MCFLSGLVTLTDAVNLVHFFKDLSFWFDGDSVGFVFLCFIEQYIYKQGDLGINNLDMCLSNK